MARKSFWHNEQLNDLVNHGLISRFSDHVFSALEGTLRLYSGQVDVAEALLISLDYVTDKSVFPKNCNIVNDDLVLLRLRTNLIPELLAHKKTKYAHALSHFAHSLSQLSGHYHNNPFYLGVHDNRISDASGEDDLLYSMIEQDAMDFEALEDGYEEERA